jgi:YD repeat-containing protein
MTVQRIPIIFLIVLWLLCILFTITAGCIDRPVQRTEIVVIKFDHAGQEQWKTVIQNPTYSKSVYQFSNTLTTTSDNSVFIAGTFINSSSARQDLRIIRIDPDGTVAWDRIQSGVYGEVLGAACSTNGRYLVIGRNGVVYSFNPDGLLEWTRDSSGQLTRQQSAAISLTAMTSPAPDTIVMVGDRISSVSETLVFGLSPEGNVTWQTSLKRQERQGYPMTRIVLASGNNQYLIGGSIYQPPAFPDSAIPWVALINQNGSPAWEKTFGPCPGEVLSIGAVPGTRFDILYQVANSSSCASDPNMFTETVLDAGGDISNQSVIILPPGPDPGSSQVFILAADPDRASERMFVKTRFVVVKSQDTGRDLALSTTDPWGTVRSDVIVPWTSDAGYVTPLIDAIERTPDGGFVLLGKTYYY